MCKITKALYEGGHRIRFTFADGSVRLADFGPFISASDNPLIRKFIDTDLFSRFRIEHWGLTVAWGDNEFDLSAEDIYNGDFDPPLREGWRTVTFKHDGSNPELDALIDEAVRSGGAEVISVMND